MSSSMELPKKRVIFIAGLTHSGSTLLSRLLTSTDDLIGLGEVVPLLTHSSSKLQERERRCSCGRSVAGCRFWSRVSREGRQESNQNFQEMYSSVLETFSEVFGETKIPVDSSKSLKALKLVSSIPGVELTIIHLVRDVRGWLVSRRDVDARRRREGNPEEIPRWQRTALGRFFIWYHGNRRLIEFAEQTGLERVAVSYEGLALRTEEVMNRLTDALNIQSTYPLQGEAHVLLGNRMRLREDSAVIKYDYRWLARSDWHLPSLLLPGIMKHNEAWVYRSISSSGVSGSTSPVVTE